MKALMKPPLPDLFKSQLSMLLSTMPPTRLFSEISLMFHSLLPLQKVLLSQLSVMLNLCPFSMSNVVWLDKELFLLKIWKVVPLPFQTAVSLDHFLELQSSIHHNLLSLECMVLSKDLSQSMEKLKFDQWCTSPLLMI